MFSWSVTLLRFLVTTKAIVSSMQSAGQIIITNNISHDDDNTDEVGRGYDGDNDVTMTEVVLTITTTTTTTTNAMTTTIIIVM